MNQTTKAAIERILGVVLFVGVLFSAWIHVTSGPTVMLLGDVYFGAIMVYFTLSPPHADG